MDLLLFSDVHGKLKHCRKIVEEASKADVVIGAGDFGNMRQGVKKVIDVLKDIETPTIVVPGNAESYEELLEACQSWPAVHVLHGNGVRISNMEFFGIGGGIPVTPFGSWSYDFSEEEAGTLLKDCPEQAVLVSHSPPKGVADVSSAGKSLGSTAVYETINDKNPPLVVCGHIHESWGRTGYIGNSFVINAGPKGVWYTL